MARRRRERIGAGAGINIDPLMDVVTCVVGIMLFVVIFAVIEARGSRVEMVTPRLQSPPAGADRHIFLCEGGRVREFPIDAMTDRFWEQRRRVTYDAVPGMVRQFSALALEDDYFTYRAEYETDRGVYTDKRIVHVIAEKRAGRVGESVEDLEAGASVYDARIEALAAAHAWLSFVVDDESIDVFRAARAKAIAHGVAVGWDPATLKFPYRTCLVGCGGGPSGRLAAGPQTR